MYGLLFIFSLWFSPSSVSGNACGMDKRIQGNWLWRGRCCWYAEGGHQEKKCELFLFELLMYSVCAASFSRTPPVTVTCVLGIRLGHRSSGEWHCWDNDDLWIWGSELWDWPYCRYGNVETINVSSCLVLHSCLEFVKQCPLFQFDIWHYYSLGVLGRSVWYSTEQTAAQTADTISSSTGSGSDEAQ